MTTARGFIIVHQLPENGDPLHELKRVVMRHLGSCIVILNLSASEHGWIIKLGVVKARHNYKERRIRFTTHEIEQPIFLRVEDGIYYVEYHEKWRDDCTISKRHYKLPKLGR